MYKDRKLSCDNWRYRDFTYDLCCARKSYFQPARDNRTCLLDVDSRAPDDGESESQRHEWEKQQHEKEKSII